MNTLTAYKAAAAAMAANSIDPTEGAIIARIIEKALSLGYAISVFDGEEYSVQYSIDPAIIGANVGATDENTLCFHRIVEGTVPSLWSNLGGIFLVHGNGEDVISNSSDNEEINALCEYATGGYAFEASHQRIAALDALAAAFVAARPDLRAMSLDEFLAQHDEHLTADERAAGQAILAMHNAETFIGGAA